MELILANNEEWLKSQLIGINYKLENENMNGNIS